MAKLSLATITSGYAAVDRLNANFDAIEEALENTLSRDGSSPNTMEANLDMNSNRILNLPVPLSAGEPLRLGDLSTDSGSLIEEITNQAEAAGAAKTDALAAQAAAELAETNAETAATAAAASETAAAASATAAAASQTAAATSATAAQTAETNAETAETNAEAAATLAQGYAAALTGTSVTSLTIGTGTKVFTTQADKQWALGQRLRAASDDGLYVMDGEVTAYSGTSLTIDVDYTEGSATHADWNISIVGARGATGPQGEQGIQGEQGPEGPAGGLTSAAPENLGPTADAGNGSLAAREDHVHQYPLEAIQVACSDESTALAAGAGKMTFRMPYAFTVTAVRASLTTAQTSGSIFTVDINEAGTTILSTKLTIDNGEKTSTTAATPAVVSDAALADDAEITIDIDQIGDGTAKGLKVSLIGRKA